MMLREIQGPVGRLEALLAEPESAARAVAVVAHPHPQYGGTMHSKVVYHTAKALARMGCAALRFNFRGVGLSAGAYDEGNGEQDDFRAALDFLSERYPRVPMWSAGMSFGARVALVVGASDPRVTTLIGIATPTSYDLSAVTDSPKAKFFIHGERDELFPLKEIRELYARAAEPKELVVIDGADHVFDGKVSEVADAVEDLLTDWSS